MQLLQPPGPDASFALRALKAVALANGDLDQSERALLRAAASVYGASIDVDTLPSIGKEELSRALTEPKDRAQLVDACVVMALADEEASEEEWRLLHELTQAFSLEEAWLRQRYDVALEQRRLAQLEMMRRQLATVLREVYQTRGQRGLSLFFHSQSGKSGEDPAVSWRYRKLGLSPKGTLGRELWRYCRARDFGLPGETGGLPESLLYHDLLHVLTGYSTEPEGELCLGAFTSAMRRDAPFPYLYFVLLEFEKNLSPSGAKFARALERGERCLRDLSRDWDFWSDIERPLDELRARYGIEPQKTEAEK